ncbi:hypothetical protein I7I51_04542 [Histoplasma capsulatum]|uniref:Uncharacterized protein n=1 Tax=Ajellomyces capsulatus TaxID=5037 RepID=A0A8A1MCL6_AJECA|nr:predicted protein [Histoplasma mississippiense (nom. inval.)]EDN07545.1 predicted protein [Histoplasma mississippiense (nom. inval.)]QSS62364.1 hypothetical protein I7I51_04542 [Histoplasma capsulatum]
MRLLMATALRIISKFLWPYALFLKFVLAKESSFLGTLPSVGDLGSFHNTTTVTATGEKLPNERHCTLSMFPGHAKVHIYVDHTNKMALDDMKSARRKRSSTRQIYPGPNPVLRHLPFYVKDMAALLTNDDDTLLLST